MTISIEYNTDINIDGKITLALIKLNKALVLQAKEIERLRLAENEIVSAMRLMSKQIEMLKCQ
ncbi:MAG: hypothetical protein V3U58_04475 [Thermodesulfobacteriota bacterium]